MLSANTLYLLSVILCYNLKQLSKFWRMQKMLKIPAEVIEASADGAYDDFLHTSAKLLGG